MSLNHVPTFYCFGWGCLVGEILGAVARSWTVFPLMVLAVVSFSLGLFFLKFRITRLTP